MEGNNTTGNIIKELRREKRLKMYELGEIIGVSKSCISNYESGYNIPSRANLIKLSEYFDVNMDFLLGKTKLRDRFINYVIGMKVPIYEENDIDSIVNSNESKMIGVIDIPRFSDVDDDLKQTFSIKVTDGFMTMAGIDVGSYIIAIKGEDIFNGKVSVVAYDGKIYVCRVHICDDKITIIPDSHDRTYLPIQVDKKEVTILGKVRKVINNVN